MRTTCWGGYYFNWWRNKEDGFIFDDLGEAGYWWSASEEEEYSAIGFYLEKDDYIRIDWFHKNKGVSIRCIKYLLFKINFLERMLSYYNILKNFG